jgi:hypothetical protein
MTGIANAAVLPEPVSAKPIISLSFRLYGKDSAYIFVGALYPIFLMASHISGQTPTSSNVKLVMRLFFSS